MKKIIFVIILTIFFSVSVFATDHSSNSIFIGFTFNIGTFSAGDNYGGSIFLGGSLFIDWLPNKNIGLSYGLETALFGGKKQENTIFGIPIIFRLGWHPHFLQFEKFNTFLLAKLGWGLGIWGDNLDEASTPSGIVCGFNFGANYTLNSNLRAYTEIGYNYYGFARNSNYPEYPLGYGSGKVYSSVGLTINLF
ncbi:MAG: hypothetical protein FWD28_07295 [Treponema sp.]|nr:hypothetical protein [Treponema sp.]